MDMLKYTDFCAKQAHISVQKLKTWLSEWGLVWGRRKRKSTPKKRMYQLITREKPISSESSATTQLTTWSWIVSMWSERWSQVPLAIFVKSCFCTKACLKAISERIADMIALDLWAICMVEGVSFREMLALLEPAYKVPLRKLHQDHAPEIGVGAGKMSAKGLTNHANHWHVNKLCYGGVHDNDTSWDLWSFLWATTAFYQTSHIGASIAEEDCADIQWRKGVFSCSWPAS